MIDFVKNASGGAKNAIAPIGPFSADNADIFSIRKNLRLRRLPRYMHVQPLKFFQQLNRFLQHCFVTTLPIVFRH